MRLGHSVKLRKQIMRRISELQVKNNIESGQTPTESRRKREVVVLGYNKDDGGKETKNIYIYIYIYICTQYVYIYILFYVYIYIYIHITSV